MIFAEIALDKAMGAVLAHSLKAGKTMLKKGRVLSAADVAALRESGRATVTVARLEPGDLAEDEAARRIAASACGGHVTIAAPFTGRCNLHAAAPGLVVVHRERLDRLNAVHESITLATLAPFELVSPRDMVATVKIVPFAVAGALVEACIAIASEGGALVRVAALRPRPVALIQTTLPGLKESLLNKTLESINVRLAALGCPPASEARCAHDETALARALAEAKASAALLLVSGASAITDRRDVVPAALVRAGGAVDHLGMPVDPGNLLMLGRLGDAPVLGLPGCARSPKVNGFDWVLQRLVADLPVTGADIMRMGAGGLLKEIPSRPQPRAGDVPAARPALKVAALVLAAGRSSRMGDANKLLADLGGEALVVRTVDAALASLARPVIVVTGHEAERVRALMRGRDVMVVHNRDYAEGLSTSLRRGLAALPADTDGVLVCLGDMPTVPASALDRLIAAFNPLEGRAICVPTWKGKRGNPVLFARRFLAEMSQLEGDLGARHLIGEHAELVAEVPMPDASILVDVDTPDALAALRRAGTAAEI